MTPPRYEPVPQHELPVPDIEQPKPESDDDLEDPEDDHRRTFTLKRLLFFILSMAAFFQASYLSFFLSRSRLLPCEAVPHGRRKNTCTSYARRMKKSAVPWPEASANKGWLGGSRNNGGEEATWEQRG